MSHLTPTANFKLNLPSFNTRGWHSDFYENMRIIDAVMATAISISSFRGTWKNSTMYDVGDKTVDPDTDIIYTAQIAHTSPATGEMADDRTAHPTYWQAFSIEAHFRGAWAQDEDYVVNDFVISGHQYAVCVEAHTAGATFSGDSSKWVILVDLTTDLAAAAASAADAAVSAAAAAASAGTVIGFLQGCLETTSVTLSFSTDNGFLIAVDATASSRTITLPAASASAGFRCTVKKIDASANTVTVQKAGSDTIDGAASYVLSSQYDAVQLTRRSASLWSIVSSYNVTLPVARGGTGTTAAGTTLLTNIGLSTYAAASLVVAASAAAARTALGISTVGDKLFTATDDTYARTAALSLTPPSTMALSAIRTGFATYYGEQNSGTVSFTSNFIKANLPAGVDYIDVLVWAGGGGASAGDTSVPVRGNGGGGGEYAEYLRLPVASLAATETIIVAARAAAGQSAGAAGQSGRSSSFGTWVVANGGTNGATATSGAASGALGGSNGAGNLTIPGGAAGYRWSNTDGFSEGGDCPRGGMGGGSVPGISGGYPGGGGAGGNHSGAVAGGTGRGGQVLIREAL